MTQELWKAIVGYEGSYEVSSRGRVRSLNRTVVFVDGRKRRFWGKTLRNYRRTGYLYVALKLNSRRQHRAVHRLVAEAFIPNPSHLPEVNHKDNVRTNAHVDNLEWCTRLGNMQHAATLGRLNGTRNPSKAKKLDPRAVTEIRAAHAAGERVTAIARRFGVCHGVVSAVIKRTLWREVA